MARHVEMLLISLLTCTACSGCAVIRAEQTVRGGYANKVSDDLLVRAPTKASRVLRSMEILSTLVQYAQSEVKGQDNILAYLKTVDSTARDLGVVYAISQTKPETACSVNLANVPAAALATPTIPTGCYDPTFDQHMEKVVNDLFQTAALSLPRQNFKSLISAASGNWLSALNVFTKVFLDAAGAARAGFAGYRDMVDASAAVAIRNTPAGSSADPDLKTAYQEGDGNFKSYSSMLDTYMATVDPSQYIVQPGDFAGPLLNIAGVCAASSWATLASLAQTGKLDNSITCSDALGYFMAGYQGYQNRTFGLKPISTSP